MTDSIPNSNSDDPDLRTVQIERDVACVAADAEPLRRQEAEKAQNVAVSQAAHKDVAELVARNDAYIRHALEQAMTNAKKRADQERFDATGYAEENSLLREKLLAERKAASNGSFGLMLVSILVVVGLIAGGIWYFSSRNNANNPVASGVAPGVVATTTSTAKSTDVSAPAKLPAAIHVNPAPPAAAGDLSGAALGSSGSKPASAAGAAETTAPTFGDGVRPSNP